MPNINDEDVKQGADEDNEEYDEMEEYFGKEKGD